ncbi:MAG: helix-turn-helix domain-containing protein [Candidatus Marinimicrobia bacterium]|nr:helix-turn-helix domain-containing protein [Candidatus Neomarinimicrobiota bacterium]
MANFYEELRESRLARGLSIEDIASVTKINPIYLHAVESGEYEVLPEPYIVLFIRAYAKEIGMDPDDAARRYRLFRAAEQLPKEKRRARRELAEGDTKSGDDSDSKFTPRLMWAGIVIVFGILLVSVKFCGVEEPIKTSFEESVESGDVSSSDKSSIISDTLAAADSVVSDSIDAVEFVTPVPMSLRIMSMDSVRVRVVVITDDGEPDDITFQRLGEERTWKANDQFSLRISKTRSVAIYLDEQLLPPLGPRNTWVSRAIINKEGIVKKQTILRARN